MSNFLLRQRLEAEAASLSDLLTTSHPDDVLGRFSLSARLKAVERDLTSLKAEQGTRAQIALIFDGRPVLGASAINASFGSKAVDQFQRAVSTAFAVQATAGRVGQRGPTISSDMAALHITGVTHGSFGFVLEEIDPKGDQWTTSALQVAADTTIDILERVSSASEQEADSTLDEVNDRLFVNVRDFIRLIHDHRASVKIAERERIVELNESAVASAYERVAEATIIDEELLMTGIIQGVLPSARRFEFGSGELSIRGKVAKDISEEYLKSLESDPLVGHRVEATFRKRTVRDTTSAIRESYILVRIAPETGAASHLT